jgi:hypothetical protein
MDSGGIICNIATELGGTGNNSATGTEAPSAARCDTGHSLTLCDSLQRQLRNSKKSFEKKKNAVIQSSISVGVPKGKRTMMRALSGYDIYWHF